MVHDAGTKVAVEFVVARAVPKPPASSLRGKLEPRSSHLNSELLGLVAASDDASVVVAQYDARPPHETWVEHPLTTHIEAVDIDQLVKIATSFRDRGHTPAHITADREFFAGKKIEKLHTPIRELGYTVVTDYKRDQLGVKGGHGGALQIEGRHYCPGMPKELQNASVDAEAKRIDRETHDARIEARQSYELRAKERPDAKGRQPMMCPALGPQAKVVCPLRERHPNSSKKPKRPVLQKNVPSKIDGELPAICCQSSVSFPATAGLKYKQQLRFGSPEWEKTTSRDRNISEGYHSFIKDTSHDAFAERGERRMRGLAAQQFLATFLVVSANLRAIHTFIVGQYVAAAYGVVKNRAPHVSDYRRNWFKDAKTSTASTPEPVLRT